MNRSTVIAIFLALVPLREGAAQSTTHACFWPAPRPKCSSWLITEAGVSKRFTDVQPDDEHTLFSWTLGWMHNANPLTAWGGELFAGVEGELRGGVAVRTRRWLSPGVATDLVTGIHLFGDASSQRVTVGSPTAMLRVSYEDMVSVSLRMDILTLRCQAFDCDPRYIQHPNGRSTRVYLGAELGNRLGVLAYLVTGALIGLVIAVCCGD